MFGTPVGESPSVTEDLAGWMRSLRNRGRSALARDEEMKDQLEEEERLRHEQIEREKKEAEESGGSGAFDFLGRILDRYRKGSVQPNESDSDEEEIDQSYLQEKAGNRSEAESESEEEEDKPATINEVPKAMPDAKDDDDQSVVELLSSDEEENVPQQNGQQVAQEFVPPQQQVYESDEAELFGEEEYDDEDDIEEEEEMDEEEMDDEEMDDYYDEEDRDDGYGRYPEEDYELIDDGEEVQEEHPPDWNAFNNGYANLAHAAVQDLNQEKIHESEENTEHVEPLAEATNFAMFIDHAPSQVDSDVAQSMIQDMNSFHNSQEIAIDSQLFEQTSTVPEQTKSKPKEYKAEGDVVDLEEEDTEEKDNSSEQKKEESTHNDQQNESADNEKPADGDNKKEPTSTATGASVQQKPDISKLVNRNLPESAPLQSLRDINPFYTAEDAPSTLSRYQEMTKAANERLGTLTMNFSFGSSSDSSNKRKRDEDEGSEQERINSNEQPRPKSARTFQPKIHIGGNPQPELENRLPSPVNFVGFSDRALGLEPKEKQEVETSRSKGATNESTADTNLEAGDRNRQPADIVTDDTSVHQPVEEVSNPELVKPEQPAEELGTLVQNEDEGSKQLPPPKESEHMEPMEVDSVVADEHTEQPSAEDRLVQDKAENVNETQEEMEVDNVAVEQPEQKEAEEQNEVSGATIHEELDNVDTDQPAKTEKQPEPEEAEEQIEVDETVSQGESNVHKPIEEPAEDEKFEEEPIVPLDAERVSAEVNDKPVQEEKKTKSKAKSKTKAKQDEEEQEEVEKEKENANHNEEDDLNLLSPQKPKKPARGRKPRAEKNTDDSGSIASRVLRSRSKKSDPEPEQPAEPSPPKKRVTRSMAKESEEPDQSTPKSRKSSTAKRGAKRKVNLNKR